MSTSFIQIGEKHYNVLSTGKVYTKVVVDPDTQESSTLYFMQYFGGQDIEIDQNTYQDIIDGKYTDDVSTYKLFPSSWEAYTTINNQNTINDFCHAVDIDAQASVGDVYLGELNFSSVPFAGNAEAVVEIIDKNGSYKTLHITVTSGNVAPYRWEYTYWNGGSSYSGWIGFQPQLTQGVGINITDSTIKATGVEYKIGSTIQQSALKFVKLTQAEYDALVANSSVDSNTLYIIY